MRRRTGTGVRSSPGRSRVGFLGCGAPGARTTAHFGRLGAVDDREYPMTDLGTAFLREVLGRAPDRAETGLLVRSHLAEGNEGVRHLPCVGEPLTGLAADYRLAVVSNTQDAELLPGTSKRWACGSCSTRSSPPSSSDGANPTRRPTGP
ncbi:hypothetical protein B9W68_28730 [Streptomyces sp. CS227]|uniref:hypothetical protein n=1 Tax=Streptomyces sp. CS227 TaxID=1982763 RepID=UPI000B40C7AB|nr:hypothetical protein [Streptomyces sp. CS227]OWA02458.1 hypothetical protein B9W68_28730 [Streptomyces sp. CS227]